MKCHSCNTEPATVGLLCRGCVEKNRARGEERKVATINKIRQQSERDSLIHKALTSWEFKVFGLCAYFVLSLIITSKTGMTASASFPVQVLVSLFYTSSLLTMAAYVHLWLAMYRSSPHQGGLLTIVLYVLFPGVVWRWGFANFRESWMSLACHFIGLGLAIFSVSSLSVHLNGSTYDAVMYITHRNAPTELAKPQRDPFYHAN